MNGDGPCNRERLGTRVKAHNEGAWVREAALAHAEKQRQRAQQHAARATRRAMQRIRRSG
ncbi:MAG: 1,2-phenylacetyl-CoA epoxidase, subunit A (EC [uncultured Paraburkholderia sp.]|nr:MAG: 1,2-phenylacetyl-CoA epoxidase, subunit A (EC [uncultured Paraburkholderia sp.]